MITERFIFAIDDMIAMCSDENQKLGMKSLREMLCDLDGDAYASLNEEERREWLSQFLSCEPSAAEAEDDGSDLSELIIQLRKYSEQAKDNHDNYIAEDLEEAASALERMSASADAPHAHWIASGVLYSDGYNACSHCGGIVAQWDDCGRRQEFANCPHCRAIMGEATSN